MLAHNVSPFQQQNSSRRAYDLEQHAALHSPRRSLVSPISDTRSALTAQQLDIAREPFIIFGNIVDSVAYCNFYKVQLARNGSVIGAAALTKTSLEISGSRQLDSYQLGSAVIVLWHPHMSFGIILGCVPDFMLSPLDACSDFIAQGSNVGLTADGMETFPFDLGDGIVDFSAGRPVDTIGGCEWGAITETGLLISLDQFMVAMRVDEETGIFGFYHDQLLRLCGHNLEMRTAGSQQLYQDDESEFNHRKFFAAYPWEAYGAFDRVTTLHRLIPESEIQQDTPWYAHTEPFFDDQQAIHRLLEFEGGYLSGPGYKRSLCILPDGSSGLQQYPDLTKFPGVAEESWHPDGSMRYRTAKDLFLVKRLPGPHPKEIRLPEDTAGDTATNYRASGVYGAGSPHLVGDIPAPAGTANCIRLAAVRDIYLHSAWKDLLALHYHGNDWYLPNEDDYPFAASMTGGNPPFNRLKTCQYLLAPVPIRMQVDERYGQVMYFPNDSYIALLDDGGIVISDGYGASLSLTGGTIFRSCPGDIIDAAGRDHICLSGRDFVARGNRGAELVANQCDVRIKAQVKCLIMGGNGTCGGVLIESKSSGVAFDTVTNATTTAASICQTGGEPSGILVSVDDSLYSNVAKDYYTIKVVATNPAGTTATLDIFNAADSLLATIDTVLGTAASLGVPIAIGTKGLKVTFTVGPFVVGQEWVAAVSRDANDTADEIIGGIIIRARESAVVTFAKHIHSILPPDGTDGSIVLNAQKKGVIITHADHFYRHMETDAMDVFWDTSSTVISGVSESVSATEDASLYYGPTVTYTITVTASDRVEPLTPGATLARFARLSVVASDGVDSDDGVIPAVYGTPTKIGERGFRVTFFGSLTVGQSYVYTLTQTATPVVNEYRRDFTLIDTRISIHDNVYISGTLMVKDDAIVGGCGVAGDLQIINTTGIDALAAAEAAHDTRDTELQTWAASARPEISRLQDTTHVLKLEFFFRSSHVCETEPSWKLFENHWQQMARIQGASPDSWTENTVTGVDAMAGVPSQPPPGIWEWTLYKGYFKEDLNLFQLTTNLAVDLGAAYETPTFATPVDVVLQGNYKVTEN